jgi:hypothetical protein
MKVILNLPAGLAIFASLALQIKTSNAVAIEVEVPGEDAEAAYDLIAEEAAAAGRSDILTACQHSYDRPVEDGTESVRVVYSPLGRRIEQTFDEAVAAVSAVAEENARIDEVNIMREENGEKPIITRPFLDPALEGTAAELGKAVEEEPTKEPKGKKSDDK